MPDQSGNLSPDLAIAEYARQVASSDPTPGGGSVSGVTGALAAALAGMVCALALKGVLPDELRATLESAERSAGALRATFLKLAVADERAYAGYRAAAALPKVSADEKRVRLDAVQLALIEAAEAPLAIARAGRELLAMLPSIAANGARHALSDAAASALLGEAALRAALLNVRVNAAMIKNPEQSAHFLAAAGQLETDGAAFRSQTLDIIRAR